MDPGTGKLYEIPGKVPAKPSGLPDPKRVIPVANEEEARALGLVPVRRKLTPIERSKMQIALYAPCACGSGRKFKFCCYTGDGKYQYGGVEPEMSPT
jgi:hypothetical protein